MGKLFGPEISDRGIPNLARGETFRGAIRILPGVTPVLIAIRALNEEGGCAQLGGWSLWRSWDQQVEGSRYTQWLSMIHASGVRSECELVRQMSWLWRVQSLTVPGRWRRLPDWRTELGENGERQLAQLITSRSE